MEFQDVVFSLFFNKFFLCQFFLKFVYSEKATKFCEISTLLLSTVHTDKSKVEISQNFVAFSEYTNFSSYLFEEDGTSEGSE